MSLGAKGDLFGDLRTSFLIEGQEQSRLLLRALDNGFDVSQAERIAHHWVGCGGFLGFPEISEWAVEIQSLLRQPKSEVAERLRQGFTNMARLFTGRIETGPVPTPEPIRAPAVIDDRLADSSVAMIGFTGDELGNLRQALDAIPAFSRSFPCEEAPPSHSRLDRFDLLVVRLCERPDRCTWGRPDSLERAGCRPLLLVGPPHAVARQSAVFGSPNRDFLVTPWTIDELLLRARQVLAVQQPQPRHGSTQQPEAKQVRVLVADDDPTITSVVGATLQNHGLVCHLARDGGEALETAQSWSPNLIILDVMMPKLDGFEVLSRLKAESNTRHIPVVLLTARQQEADIVRGFALGADEYIVKPFNPMELVARLRRFLR